MPGIKVVPVTASTSTPRFLRQSAAAWPASRHSVPLLAASQWAEVDSGLAALGAVVPGCTGADCKDWRAGDGLPVCRGVWSWLAAAGG